MNVLDTSSHGDRPICQIWYANVKTQKLQVRHEHKIKAYKLDLEVKDRGRMGFINVCDTLRHGDTPMCQIWQDMSNQKKSHGPDTKTCQKL